MRLTCGQLFVEIASHFADNQTQAPSAEGFIACHSTLKCTAVHKECKVIIVRIFRNRESLVRSQMEIRLGAP